MYCPPGFYCDQGTSWDTRFNNKCPAGYFCPKGTHRYSEFSNDNGEGDATTTCPEGTGLDE